MSEAIERFREKSRTVAYIGIALIVVGVAMGGYRAIKKYQVPGLFARQRRILRFS